MSGHYAAHVEIEKARQAVIDAARSWANAPTNTWERLPALTEAVEQLDAAEDRREEPQPKALTEQLAQAEADHAELDLLRAGYDGSINAAYKQGHAIGTVELDRIRDTLTAATHRNGPNTISPVDGHYILNVLAGNE